MIYIVQLYMLNAALFAMFFALGELDFYFWRRWRFWATSLMPGGWVIVAIAWLIDKWRNEF